ncbi:hypothetical protein [Magnetospirillum sulfuroxidans]|uniref:Uncharacterized protein n=1 Tax=Magnetospirillum sulfuroxidans TaxID=611300 RepID=A0ABS5I8B0_9PROT|nr:hypothetical protein [Magnetospirillum sulfuroxidans]MBR9970667.1 hypothetical protein [Magnetospirillum sulfuroxidans]
MNDNIPIIDLLAHWQAFSQLQQRAFEFLASEAIATGQEFEHSTAGATGVLTRIGQFAGESEAGELQARTNEVVQRLQAADRSRQGLEQVASVLTTLRRQHAALEEATQRHAQPPAVDDAVEQWIAALSENVSLADWRRRLIDALYGRESKTTIVVDDDIELF